MASFDQIRSDPQALGRQNLPLQLCGLLILAAACGGGGVAYAFVNLALQLVALAILAFNRDAASAIWREQPRWLVLLILLTLAVPLIHLLPLPPGVWRALPGRELAAEARDLVGAAGWYPLSLDPGRTLVAATGLIAPFVVLALALRLPRPDLEKLGWLIVGLGFVQLLLGVLQVLSEGRIGLLYPENPMPGVLFGTFANRNSAGLFLFASVTIAALIPLQDRCRSLVRWVLVTALVIALLLTRSRSAVVLLTIPAGLVLVKAVLGQTSLLRTVPGRVTAIAVLLVAAAASLATIPQTRLGDTFERFSHGADARMLVWDDAAYSARKYWPAGAGMGTFDEVFQADESLEHISPRSAGRAHNDYLELSIEAGAPGILLALCWLLATGLLALKARNAHGRWTAWAGAAILSGTALQSIVDYPLRNQATLCLAAFAFALLLRHAQPCETRE